jgi:hypothetical protein
MVDNRALVYTILFSTGYSADYNYPASFASFPCMSYFDSGHIDTDYSDGIPHIDITEFTVDVWEKEDNQGNLIEIHPIVDTNMKAAGFTRVAFINQLDTDTQVRHITFKFNKPEEEV